MDYAAIKLVPQTAVIISGVSFFMRGVASLRSQAWMQSRTAKTLPHIIDTLLLLSAITLATLDLFNPIHTPWLTAKMMG
jgi:uncharacterized membrane protein SirB2